MRVDGGGSTRESLCTRTRLYVYKHVYTYYIISYLFVSYQYRRRPAMWWWWCAHARRASGLIADFRGREPSCVGLSQAVPSVFVRGRPSPKFKVPHAPYPHHAVLVSPVAVVLLNPISPRPRVINAARPGNAAAMRSHRTDVHGAPPCRSAWVRRPVARRLSVTRDPVSVIRYLLCVRRGPARERAPTDQSAAVDRRSFCPSRVNHHRTPPTRTDMTTTVVVVRTKVGLGCRRSVLTDVEHWALPRWAGAGERVPWPPARYRFHNGQSVCYSFWYCSWPRLDIIRPSGPHTSKADRKWPRKRPNNTGSCCSER